MSARASLDRVVDAAGRVGANPRPAGMNAFRAVALCHGGNRADTLSIRYHPDKAYTSVHCFKGCDRDAILWALNLTRPDQHDEPRTATEHSALEPRPIKPAEPGRPPTLFEPAPLGWTPTPDLWMPPWCSHAKVAEYLYRDEAGRILYGVARCVAKCFAQWRPAPERRTGRRWKLAEKDPKSGRAIATVRIVPFRLPELRTAVRAGADVFVVEGEKDADAVASAGHAGTCGKGGCGEGWHAEYNQHFQGADVTIVADRDMPGRKHAESITAALLPVAASLRVVIAEHGKDAHDHLAAGGTVETFRSVWTPKPKNLEPSS
ncbi:MAG TPA: hypothetical protein VGM10_04625 [Actinocrinis sp.]|jgi:hypothetical protein